MLTRFSVLLVIALISPLYVHAQAGPQGVAQAPTGVSGGEETPGHPGFWQARIGSGHYMVKIGSIQSISKHEYIVDGQAKVTEVTIGASTEVVARFYYLESIAANSPLNVGQQAMQRAGDVRERVGQIAPDAVALQVVKSYPLSTHAHTVEYVLQSLGALDSLYQSLGNAVVTGRGVVWTGN